MSETLEQNPEFLQSLVLIQYLDQRRTQPVGVVNTRQFQFRFLRISAAITQRFILLNQLRSRYGIADDHAFANTDLTLAMSSQPSIEMQSNTLSQVTQSVANLPKLATVTANSQPTENFRISRKLILPLDASNSVELQKKTESEIKNRKENITNLNSRDLTQVSATLLKTSNSSAIASSPDLIFPQKSNPSPAKNIASESVQLPTETPLAKSRVTRPAELPVSLPLAKAKLTPLIQRSQQLKSLTEKQQILPDVSRFEQSKSGIVKNTPLLTTEKQQISPVVSQLDRSKNTTLITSEISLHQSSLPQPKMIFRKSSDNPSAIAEKQPISESTFTSASISQNSQFNPSYSQASSHSKSLNAESETDPLLSNLPLQNPAQTSLVNSEFNVNHIAEQVSRILSRRLTVERERRGLNR